MRKAALLLFFILLLIVPFVSAFSCYDKCELDESERVYCHKHCWCTDPNSTPTIEVEFKSEGESIFRKEGDNYIAPVNSWLSVSTTAFNDVCANGDRGQIFHPLVVFLKDGQSNNLILTNNFTCDGHGSSCHGPAENAEYALHNPSGGMCKGKDKTDEFHFMREGDFEIRIEYAKKNNGTDWEIAKSFRVRIVSPELVINASNDRIIPFKINENEKEFLIPWTVKNISNTMVRINSVEALGCEDEGITCSFDEVVDIEPNQSVILFERITALKPQTIVPLPFDLSVRIKYSDAPNNPNEESLITKTVESDPSNPVTIWLALVDDEKFHVELFAGKEAEYCIGANGEFGGTGPGEVKHVLLSWSWDDILIDTCDKKSDSDEFKYCDPTQFSIELVQKFEKIRELAGQGNISEITSYQHFYAYLIGDNYNDDFKLDFDYYYTKAEGAFFQAPSYYTEPPTPWSKYFSNTSRLVFSNFGTTEISSGLYKIDLEFTWDEEEWQFFNSNYEPTASITVNFTKIRDPLRQNVFYYLPFNGMVGTKRKDVEQDGSVGRKGYGLKFNNVSSPITISKAGPGKFVDTSAIVGSNEVTTEFISDFYRQNLTERGIVLSINKGYIGFSPSDSIPVLMKLREENNKAFAYYSLAETGEQSFGESDYLSLWNGVASSREDCKDFYGANLFSRRQDSKATIPSCVEKDENSFGFEWLDISSTGDELYLETVFYTPIDSSIILHSVCGSTGSGFATVGSNSLEQSISLTSAEKIDSLKKVLENVAEKRICVSQSNGFTKFWWNEQKILEELESVKSVFYETVEGSCQVRPK